MTVQHFTFKYQPHYLQSLLTLQTTEIMNMNNSPFRPARIIFTLFTALLSLPAWQGVMGQTPAEQAAMVCENGGVRTWGRNNNYQLGLGYTSSEENEPHVPGIANAVAVATGISHSLALLDDGTVLAWGVNTIGEAGPTPTPPSTVNTPTPITLPGCATAISAGDRLSMVLLADGTVWAWGLDDVGQLGNGATVSTGHTPVPVTGITTAIAISAGLHHGMALLADGTVWTWGKGISGQLGNGFSINSHSPVQVKTSSGNLTNVISIDAGSDHNVVLRNDNSVYTWGGNSTGQLGIGSTTASNVAVHSSGLSLGTTIDVAAGLSFTMALRSDGNTRVCGSNQYRSLGVNSQCSNTGAFLTPIAGPPFSGGVALHIPSTAGYGHVITASGQLWGWGNNLYGQVGSGSSSNYVCPPQHVNYSGSPNQCTAKPSSDNHPQPCCVAVYEDERTVIGTNGGTVTLTGTQTFTNLNMAIFGTVIINGSRTFNNCDVVMGKDAKIIVLSGKILNITNGSHLYACGDMWDGIVVNKNGIIYIQSNSIVEDAEIAVDIEYGAYYHLNNATFNRNHIHVQKTMPSSPWTYTGNYTITKCKFLCQTTASLGGSPVHDDLLPPRTGERSSVGVLALGVPKILVGNTLANANTFDNSGYGVFAWTVGRVDVKYNTMRDLTYGGAYALFGPGNGGETIDISNNTIQRVPFAINCHDNDTTVRTRITYNTIDFDGMVSPPQYMTGITVSEVTPGSGAQWGNFNFADISHNNITKAPNGIRVLNMRGDLLSGGKAKLYVGDNTITQGTKVANDWQACINMDNCDQTAIINNTMSQASGSAHYYYTGIRVDGGYEHAIQCNTATTIGQGLFFDGDLRPYTTVARNVMQNNHRGIFLNHGYVGQQGHSTRPSDNEWHGTGWSTSNPNTQVWGTGVQGSLSPFYVRDVKTPSIYIPEFNEIANGAFNAITIPSASGTWGNCEFDQASFKTDGSLADDVTGLTAIINEDEPETERGRSIRWMGEYNLYRAMQANADLQFADNALSTFYTERDGGNMGRLHRAIDGFKAARNAEEQSASEGLAALQAVQPQNRVEQTLHDLLGILYANAEDLRAMGDDHVSHLRTIARLCPLDDGFAVYMARAALLSIDTVPKGYMNVCEQVPAPEDGHNKQDAYSDEEHAFSVYPNPNNGRMTVSYVLAEGETGILRVHNTVGLLVLEKQLNASQNLMEMEMVGISSGLYLLSIEVNSGRKLTERISVVR